jgi:hypothetical protein
VLWQLRRAERDRQCLGEHGWRQQHAD